MNHNIHSTPLKSYANYIPYSEGSDIFQETIGSEFVRLFVNPLDGFLKFLPTPSPESLSKFYNGSFIRSLEPPTAEKEFTAEILNVAKGLKQKVQSLTSLSDNFTAHDIGCGFGALVYAFQQIGVNSSGNEMNEEWVKAANPFCKNAITAAPLNVCLKGLPYSIDFFTILHVLEHLPDPGETLRIALNHLSEKGLIYICVPNAQSLRVLTGGRRKDPCYSFPNHLNYFTPLSLINFLHEAGLDVVEMNTRPLFEADSEGTSCIHSLLNFEGRDQIAPDAWVNAQCANLLGGELYILAAAKGNKHFVFDQNALRKAQLAFRNFNNSRLLREQRMMTEPTSLKLQQEILASVENQKRLLTEIHE